VLYRRDELSKWMDHCRVENPQATL
jgi:hypothetical protein